MRARPLRVLPEDRRTAACGWAGEHEECDGRHPNLDGSPSDVACSCGCHLGGRPWPFPCLEDPEGHPDWRD